MIQDNPFHAKLISKVDAFSKAESERDINVSGRHRLARLRPDDDFRDVGADAKWRAQILSQEYYAPIRALDSNGACRFLTRSARWPIVFDLRSKANHFQCANALVLGPPIVQFHHFVLQEPIAVERDALHWHLKPTCGMDGNLTFMCHQPLKTGALGLSSTSSQPGVGQGEGIKKEAASLQKITAFTRPGGNYSSTQVVDGVYGGYFAIAAHNSGTIDFYRLPYHALVGSCVVTPGPPENDVELVHSVRLRVEGIKDAKVSPDRQWLVAIGDHGAVWIMRVVWDEPTVDDGIVLPPRVPTDPFLASLEYPVLIAAALMDSARRLNPTAAMRTMLEDLTLKDVAWAPCSTRFAVSSNTHPYLLVFSAPTPDGAAAKLEHVVFTARPPYAIVFHPRDRSVLAVSNRHGYVQIIDLDACDPPFVVVPKRKTLKQVAARWSADTISELADASRRYPREILPVRFGSMSCQITGLQWSLDGHFLYIATYERVLVYQFKRPSSLFDMIARRLPVSDAKFLSDGCRRRFLAATIGIDAKFRH
ncbi:hypothetical protein GGF32_005091 [Allomyces javanicus]|nr:hypothetical protein GGF32_005091 [Allomyces javanicus]